MELQKILELLEKKYGNNQIALLIFSDESGRITDQPIEPYEKDVPLFYFDNIKELISHLQEN